MQMESSYANVKKHVTIYTMCKIYKHIWIKSHYRNSGVTSFITFTENWCSHGCAKDGHVDAHEQDIKMDTMADGLA